jgi:hypothetical protein
MKTSLHHTVGLHQCFDPYVESANRGYVSTKGGHDSPRMGVRVTAAASDMNILTYINYALYTPGSISPGSHVVPCRPVACVDRQNAFPERNKSKFRARCKPCTLSSPSKNDGLQRARWLNLV